ncbi:MAG: low-specificity L-threonine aldolase [Dehalococcoidales bacterium]|nr:MAG: low-specificity L-threonine aldolase [Dehalococcoidales bacterium]
MKIIDLRSDTVTHPTQAMRKAMFEAKVGDDVYGEDPTVNRLESTAAEMMGKEDALFTTSGTQSNLIAVLTHTVRGDEIIVGNNSHIFLNEVGGAAALGGVVMHTIQNDSSGHFDLNDIERTVRGENIHYPKTTLLCMENTHNHCGGTVLDRVYTNKVCELTDAHGIKVHLDGARIFNAATALNIPTQLLTESVDSVSFCLSKGLSAPVGSMLCGSNDFIKKARKIRKMLGGGMRQAGIIAAAGIVALETMIDRLGEDHINAKRLAKGLESIKGINTNPDSLPTNIVMFSLESDLSPKRLIDDLKEAGIRVGSRGGSQFRAVTHQEISSSDIDEVLSRVEAICQKL